MLVDSQFPLRRPEGGFAGQSGQRRAAGREAMKRDDEDEQAPASIETIEYALRNLNALKENLDFYKDLAGDLRKSFEEEKKQRKDAQKQVEELKSLLRAERERTAKAESRLMASDGTIGTLRAQLETVRSEAMRLMTAVRLLAPLEIDARFGQKVDGRSLAA